MNKKFVDTLTSEQLIDIREKWEWDESHLPNARHVVKEELENFPQAYLQLNKKYYIYCRSGKRASQTKEILSNLGYNIENVGGILDYEGEIQSKEYFLDCKKLQCPAPLVQTYKKMEEINSGDILNIEATDIGFITDMMSWSEKKGHEFLSSKKEEDYYKVSIKKGNNTNKDLVKSGHENTTIVLFSGDYDKAIAAMIIAQGAAAMGKKVSIFCTFWGLSFLKDKSKTTIETKNINEKMFSKMMPNNLQNLPLSQMNFGGMGRSMIKSLMKTKNVDSLETLFVNAQNLGTKFIACSMSMDLLGVKEDELYDNVTIGGVATYLADSEDASMTLFI